MKNVMKKYLDLKHFQKLFFLCLGSFIISICYNSFTSANNLVTGGCGGISIIVHKFTGIAPSVMLNILSGILLILSIILLGFKHTSHTIIGYLGYAIFIAITAPFASHFVIKFDSFLISTIFYGILSGLGSGLIYRMGFSTGGSDSICEILQKYTKLPFIRLSNVVNLIIIVAGIATFGITKSMYAIIYLFVANFVSDKLLLGSARDKVCYIKSHESRKIENLLKNEYGVGYSIIESSNGIGFLKKDVIMCVLPSNRYVTIKNNILKIDKKANIIANNCYTVEGGYHNKILKV